MWEQSFPSAQSVGAPPGLKSPGQYGPGDGGGESFLPPSQGSAGAQAPTWASQGCNGSGGCSCSAAMSSCVGDGSFPHSVSAGYVH